MKKIIFIILLILLSLGAFFIYILQNDKEQNFQATYVPESLEIEQDFDTKKQTVSNPQILDTSLVEYQNYKDIKNGISFIYPSHYTFEQRASYSIWSGNATTTIFSNPNGPLEMRPSIRLTIFEKESENQNPETLKNYVVEKYNNFLQERIQEGAPQEADGLISYSLKTVKSNTWVELITKSYYVDVDYGKGYYYFYQKGNTVYTLYFFGLEEKVISKILNSVEFN